MLRKIDDAYTSLSIGLGVLVIIGLVMLGLGRIGGCDQADECKPTIKVLAPSWIRSPSFACSHKDHAMTIDKSWKAVTVTCSCPSVAGRRSAKGTK